jgi:HrpA-like RNA helicase
MLWLLDAINMKMDIMPLGHEMALLPVYTCAVIASKGLNCMLEIINIISVLSAMSKIFVDVTEQCKTTSES